MTLFSPLLAAVIACAVSTAATLLLIRVLGRRAILDLPNDRSLHAVPKPRGGGAAVLAGLVAGLVLTPSMAGLAHGLPLVLGAVLLAAVSARDDVRSLPPLPRFAAQIAAVALGSLSLSGNVFQGLLPPWLDDGLSALCWLWFVNLFNFMDGMDGLAGGEALAIAFGLYLLPPHFPVEIVLAGAILGFLVWNWAPSRIMLGDVGSIPLGYILGWLLLRHAGQGQWAAASILPLYFGIDATVTLLKRALRGEKVWRPHREHFYQQAVLAGRGHARVAVAVHATNVVLIFLAVVLVPRFTWQALGIAWLTVALLILWMRSPVRARA